MEQIALKLVDKFPATALVIALIAGILFLIRNEAVKDFFRNGIRINHVHDVAPGAQKAFTGAMLAPKKHSLEYEVSASTREYVDSLLDRATGKPPRNGAAYPPSPAGTGRADSGGEDPTGGHVS